MEVKLLCVAVLLVLVSTLTGIDAQSDVCGTAPLNTRIVGGQDADMGAWPWQVSIHISNSFTCGGSLINNQWVLTAAQCFPSTNTSDVMVYLGRMTQSGQNPNAQSRKVIQIIRHPEYNSNMFNHDIALVELSSPVTFNDYIRPVCLATADSVYMDGTNVWVTGWGYLQTNETLPPNRTLQEVEISVVSNSECNKVYELITVNMICAGVSSGGKGTCKGDSGGPMVTKSGSRWVQGGVVSFGSSRGCALPETPSLFTRVSQYESWINSKITTNQPGFITFSASSSVGPATGVFLTVLLSVYVLS